MTTQDGFSYAHDLAAKQEAHNIRVQNVNKDPEDIELENAQKAVEGLSLIIKTGLLPGWRFALLVVKPGVSDVLWHSEIVPKSAIPILKTVIKALKKKK